MNPTGMNTFTGNNKFVIASYFLFSAYAIHILCFLAAPMSSKLYRAASIIFLLVSIFFCYVVKSKKKKLVFPGTESGSKDGHKYLHNSLP